MSATMITCEICKATFSQKSNLYKHQRNIHNITVDAQCFYWKCALCEQQIRNIVDYAKHLDDIHSQGTSIQQLNFDNLPEFDVWKAELERATVAEFVVHRGTATSQQGTKQTTFYYCHRSGYFRASGKGIRRGKVSGSNKIDGVCSAFIKRVVTKMGDSDLSISVVFCDKHVGHQQLSTRLKSQQQSLDALAGVTMGIQVSQPASHCISNSVIETETSHVEQVMATKTMLNSLEIERKKAVNLLQEKLTEVETETSVGRLRIIQRGLKRICAEQKAHRIREDWARGRILRGNNNTNFNMKLSTNKCIPTKKFAYNKSRKLKDLTQLLNK